METLLRPIHIADKNSAVQLKYKFGIFGGKRTFDNKFYLK